jgi:Carboxypeptidase regulatory-like domain/TonB dependent receptor
LHLLGAVLLFGLAWLQELPATITGRVTNSGGFAIGDVEVQLLNSETGFKLSTRTDAVGFYRITNLEPGIYQLTLQKYGFKSVIRSGVELHVQDILAVNLEMNIGLGGEAVTEVEGAPLIQPETAWLGSRYDPKVISELPNLRTNPYSFAALSAGAAPLSTGVFAAGIPASFPERDARIGLAVNGQRPESARLLLDSTDNMNADHNTPRRLPPTEAVSEYRIVTNGAAAEYGGSASLVANLITKSGSNEWHGSLYDYASTSGSAANSFENNALGKPRDVFSSHQGGASLGGPVRRDKAFFFIAYEAIRIRGSGSIQGYVPTPQLAGISSPATRALLSRYPTNNTQQEKPVLIRTVTPFGGGGPVSVPAFALATRVGPADAGVGVPQNDGYFMVRFDYALSGRTRLTAGNDAQVFTSIRTLSQPYVAEWDSYAHQSYEDFSFSLTRTWSENIVSDSRLGARSMYFFTPTVGPLFPRVTIQGENPVFPTGTGELSDDRSFFYHLDNVLSWVHQRHFFKLGGEVLQRATKITLPAPGWPGLNFQDVQGLVDGRLASLTALTDFVTLREFPIYNNLRPGDQAPAIAPNRLDRGVHQVDSALFFQDMWKVRQRLTLMPGLRWEYFGKQSRNLDPERFGRDTDINFYVGNGSSYYERFANGKLLRTTNASGEYRNGYSKPDRNNFAPRFGLAFDPSGTGKTVLRAAAGIFFNTTASVPKPSAIASILLADIPLTTPMLESGYQVKGPVSPAAVVRIDQDLGTPYTTAWNATVERDFGGKVVLSGSYIGSSSSHLEAVVLENQIGSGRYVGRPGERLLNNYGLFYSLKDLAHSSYHSFQLRADGQRISRLGLQFGAGYTWAHSIDNASAREEGQIQGSFLTPSNPRLDRGSSSFDQRQRFVTHFIFELPAVNSMRFLRVVTEGWRVSGVVSLQTGQPINIVDAGLPDLGTHARPRVTGALPQVSSARDMMPDPRVPNRFLYLAANAIRTASDGSCLPNAAPFACVGDSSEIPAIYDRLDNVLPRNYYRGPGSYFQDCALAKTVRLGEHVHLQIRSEFYNLFNHANLEVVPDLSAGGYMLNNPVFDGGTIAGVLARYGGKPRQIVWAGKLVF